MQEDYRALSACNMAEKVGFEPTVPCEITGFQDRLLKPLGHLSEFADQSLIIITHKTGIVNPFLCRRPCKKMKTQRHAYREKYAAQQQRFYCFARKNFNQLTNRLNMDKFLLQLLTFLICYVTLYACICYLYVM